MKKSEDGGRLLAYALRIPYLSYEKSGIPVVLIIDEFQRVRELHKDIPGDSDSLWLSFGEMIRNRYTPHIITGSQADLSRMLFKETSLGRDLEIFTLAGLGENDTLRLISSLCDNDNIKISREAAVCIADIFRGNPFYIRSFFRRARRNTKNLTENDVQTLYTHEITEGTLHTLWVSILTSSLAKFELRKSSLELLYFLASHSPSSFSALYHAFTARNEECNDIVGSLLSAGVVEADFGTVKLIDDRPLTDVIKALYHKEVMGEPLSKFKEILIKVNERHERRIRTPVYEVTVPPAPEAELVAVKALEQIAQNWNIPSDVTGQLQASLIELFSLITSSQRKFHGNFSIRFEGTESTLNIEVTVPDEEPALPSTFESRLETQLTRSYVDEITCERVKNGARVTLRKNLHKNPAPVT